MLRLGSTQFTHPLQRPRWSSIRRDVSINGLSESSTCLRRVVDLTTEEEEIFYAFDGGGGNLAGMVVSHESAHFPLLLLRCPLPLATHLSLPLGCSDLIACGTINSHCGDETTMVVTYARCLIAMNK